MNLNLNEAQLKKIKSAHNIKTGVTVQLLYNQIGTGKQKFNLTQIKKFKKISFLRKKIKDQD